LIDAGKQGFYYNFKNFPAGITTEAVLPGRLFCFPDHNAKADSPPKARRGGPVPQNHPQRPQEAHRDARKAGE
jgi:hypothetical protein